MPRSKVFDPEWMTYLDAVPVLGRSHVTVARLVREGRIRSREQAWRAYPSLWREDVERVAAELADEERTLEEQRARRGEQRPVEAPPDDGHVWLGVATAALVLGLSKSRVQQLVAADRLPHARRGRRVWLRRDLVEQIAAARVAAREGPGFILEK